MTGPAGAHAVRGQQEHVSGVGIGMCWRADAFNPAPGAQGKYIRFIYNRIVLENATVRASAVCAMAKFG